MRESPVSPEHRCIDLPLVLLAEAREPVSLRNEECEVKSLFFAAPSVSLRISLQHALGVVSVELRLEHK